MGLLTGVLACAGSQNRSPSAEQLERIIVQRTEASRLIEQEQYAEALILLEDINRKLPDNAKTLGLLAWAQWQSGHQAAAVSSFEASIRGDYSDYLTHLRFGQALMAMAKTGRALTEFKVATELSKNEPLPHYNHGLALYHLGRQEEARDQWQRAYDLDSDNPVYLEAMGIGLSGWDDEQALVYFEKAQSLGRTGAAFSHNYALTLERLGRSPRAEAEFLRAVGAEPDRLTYRFDLAAFYMNTRAYEKAIPHWRVLQDKQSEDSSPRIYLARAYFELNRFAEAIALLDTLAGAGEFSRDDRQDEAYGILAMSYRGMGQLDRANLFIEKALEIKPDHVDYLINYGVILADRGMMDRARVQWQKALEIEPDNQTARQNLSASKR
jgi:tetratricopeptide (TPR) repeat protein